MSDTPCLGNTLASRRLRAGAVVLGIALATSALPRANAALPGERAGKAVVEAFCIECHGSGAKGAPRIGDARAWAPRASRGLTALTQSALAGVRQMPPHGGTLQINDLEIKRAITYMVNRSGGNWTEPIDRAAPPVERSGEAIVRANCVRCHVTGIGGAPRIGDKAAWIHRAQPGLDSLVRSAIKGHGAMPARGAVADLTDAEMRAAITHMFRQSVGGKK